MPSRDKKSPLFDKCLPIRPGLDFSIYTFNAACAFLPSGTMRSLLPLPKHFTKPTSIFKSLIFKLINSDTLAPVAYNNSSIALSLIPKGSLVSGSVINFSTSATPSTSGMHFHNFGESSTLVGSCFIFCSLNKNLKKILIATRPREIELAAMPLFFLDHINSVTSLCVTLSTPTTPCSFKNAANSFKSLVYACMVLGAKPLSTDR